MQAVRNTAATHAIARMDRPELAAGADRASRRVSTLHARVRAPHQNPRRKPKRTSRERPIASAADCVERIFPKFELLALPFGLAKCGVLLKLNDSARNCTFSFSVNLKVRKRLR